MHAKDLVIYDNTECEEVEHVGEVVPDISVAVFARALGVEAIGLGDAARLVVAADEVYSVGVSQFQTDKKGNGFDAEHATVDIVACGKV